ncbi:MAG TPA: hypothetical protein VFU50_15585 [Terriglobales bacterium]|nr:hypothetical protein [Terriglobales bacterium]
MTNYLKGFSHGWWVGFMLGSALATWSRKEQKKHRTIDYKPGLTPDLISFTDLPQQQSQAHAVKTAS